MVGELIISLVSEIELCGEYSGSFLSALAFIPSHSLSREFSSSFFRTAVSACQLDHPLVSLSSCPQVGLLHLSACRMVLQAFYLIFLPMQPYQVFRSALNIDFLSISKLVPKKCGLYPYNLVSMGYYSFIHSVLSTR